MLNKIMVEGRLTRNPESRQTNSGDTYTTFSVACNRNYKNSKGDYPADFINCIAWNKTAEFLLNYFSKGSYILVSGTLQNNDYNDAHGVPHYSYRVYVEQISACGHYEKDAQEKQKNTGAEAGTAQGRVLVEGFYDISEEGNEIPF